MLLLQGMGLIAAASCFFCRVLEERSQDTADAYTDAGGRTMQSGFRPGGPHPGYRLIWACFLAQYWSALQARGVSLFLPLFRFQCSDGLFELFQLFPRACQYPRLGIEFLSRHQIQSGEGGLQQAVNILLNILLCALDPGRNVVADPAGEVVNEFGIEHAATIATGAGRVQFGDNFSALRFGASKWCFLVGCAPFWRIFSNRETGKYR